MRKIQLRIFIIVGRLLIFKSHNWLFYNPLVVIVTLLILASHKNPIG